MGPGVRGEEEKMSYQVSEDVWLFIGFARGKETE